MNNFSHTHNFTFRHFLLDRFERLVFDSGKNFDVKPKTFELLQYLIEHSGPTVTKDEMLGNVWPGCFIEEGNLAVHISKLRKAFGHTPTNGLIETVHGVGYRFNAKVTAISDEECERIKTEIALRKKAPLSGEAFADIQNMQKDLARARGLLGEVAEILERHTSEDNPSF